MRLRIAATGVVIALGAAACASVQVGEAVAGSRPSTTSSPSTTGAPQITRTTDSTRTTTSKTSTTRSTTSTTRTTTTSRSTVAETPTSTTPPPPPADPATTWQFLNGALNPGDPIVLDELVSAAGVDMFSLGVNFNIQVNVGGIAVELVGHKVGPLLVDPDLEMVLSGGEIASTKIIRSGRVVYVSGGLKDVMVRDGVLAGVASWVQLDEASPMPEFAEFSTWMMDMVSLTSEPSSYVVRASSGTFGGQDEFGRRMDLVGKDAGASYQVWYDSAGHVTRSTLNTTYVTGHVMTRSGFDVAPTPVVPPVDLDQAIA